MDNRALESGASATPPSAPASPSMGYPTKGNPATPTPASKGGVYWHYQIGEELRAVLTAAGITPDHEDLTQLLTALRSAGVFATPSLGDRTTKAATMACFSQEFGASLATNGYQKLPSGLIIQWGQLTSHATPGSPVAITYPIAFPNAFLNSWCTVSSTSTSTSAAWNDSQNTTGMNVRSSIASAGVLYLAIGH